MFPAADALMKLIQELEAMGKANVAAIHAEMSKPEPVMDLGERGDFDVFVTGLGGHEKPF